MKKIIYVFLIIISLFSFFVLFNSNEMQQNNNMEMGEQKLSSIYNISIPSSIDEQKPSIIYNLLTPVLDKYNASIYYSKVDGSGNKIKFVYLNDLSYMNNFIVTKGRKLSIEDNQSNRFLGSIDTGKAEQVGKIATFSGKEAFEIHTLKDMVDSGDYRMSGTVAVQLKGNENINNFIEDLKKALNTTKIEKIEVPNVNANYSYDKWIIPILYFIIVLLILYSIIKAYKKAGVQKLLGYSNIDIWKKDIGRILLIQIIIIIVSNVFMSAILFKEYNPYFWGFLKELLFDDFKQICFLLFIASLPYIYLTNITVSNVLKNKLPLRDILIFNTVLKIIVIILFFNLIGQGISNYDRISTLFNNNYKVWEKAKNYYCVPYLRDDGEAISGAELEARKAKLYVEVNKEGAIWSDFSNYFGTAIKINSLHFENAYETEWGTVNPNYLKENTIYDTDNKAITVSEDDSRLILLVPDKYKNDGAKIVAMWEKIKNSFGENSITSKQKIHIIYIKSNQKIFTYQDEVNIKDGNMVKDAILRVITEKNGSNWDFNIILGAYQSPIKLKAENSDDPQGYIREKLKRFGLEKYSDAIVRADDAIAFESKSTYKLLIFIGVGLIVLTLAIVLIITQSIYCFFEQYKKQLAVRQLLGYKFLNKYKECFVLFLTTWVIIIITKLLMKDINIEVLMLLSSLFMLIDFVITFIIIRLVNGKKIVGIIKGAN